MSNPEFRRQKGGYFKTRENDPAPVQVSVKRRVQFHEVDVMSVVWHGNYAKYFEEAAAELGRRCGLSYQAYETMKILAPIVQFHTDYHQPLVLDELFTVSASFIWSEGARLHTEYSICRESGAVAVTGYTVQMFVNAVTREPLLVSPALLEDCRKRWQAGEFK